MGINSLNSFITEVGLRKPYRLSDTYVVIDGYNLYFVLYEQFSEDNPNDFLFGGNYTDYRKLFENFFGKLIDCNITAIVVFDEEYTPNVSDNSMERFQQKFDKSKELSDNPPNLPLTSKDQVINPWLLKKSFKSVAEIMNVHCIITESNADLEMAKLAIHLDCPLISNDTDFLVMNIKKGVISTNSLKWQNPFQSTQHYIECQVFKIDDLLQFKTWYSFDFRLNQIELKAEMLPIFGSLFGIDGQFFDGLFVEIDGQTREYSLMSNRYRNSRKFKHRKWRRMDQLLCWLAVRCHNNANEAILYIESYCLRKQNQTILDQLKESVKGYDTNGKSDLKELLDHKMMATNENQIPIEKKVQSKGQNCSLLESSMVPLIDHKVCKRPLIEDFNLESNYESSIRLKGFYLGLKRTNRTDNKPLRMTLRKGHSFEEIPIHPETHINGFDGKELPVLSELQDLSEIEKKRILFDILEFNEKWMTDLEEELFSVEVNEENIEFWKYFLIFIKYWNSNSKIKEFKTEWIESFVLSLIYFRHNSLITNEFKGMTSVKYCSGQRFKPFVIHYYCEFQSIYSSIYKLIQLLANPTAGEELLHYFNGTLLYNMFTMVTRKSSDWRPFKEDKLNKISNIIINSILKP